MKLTGSRSRRYGLAVGATVAVAAPALVWAAVSVADDNTEGAVPTDPTSQCELSVLPHPDGVDSAGAEAISPDGSYVAGWHGGNGQPQQVAVWHDGEHYELGVEADAQAHAVNDSGTVVGFVDNGDEYTHAFVYRDGEVSQVPGLDFGEATGVNSAGDVVGHGFDMEGVGDHEPFVWRADAETAESLPLPNDADSGHASDIADDGTVVGWYVDAEGVDRAYAWDAQGEGRELAGVGDSESPSYAQAVAGDWVVGGQGGAVMWSLDSGEATQIDLLDRAYAVNPDGVVAGNESDSGARYEDGERVALSPEHASLALGVSDDGVVAGSVDDYDGDVKSAVVFDCR